MILTSLSHGHKATSLKWVYKIKYNPEGTIERPKERLVISRFNQQERLDYKNTFSSMAKLPTVMVFL